MRRRRSRRQAPWRSRKCRRPCVGDRALAAALPCIPGSRPRSRTDRDRWTTRNKVGTKFDSFSGRQSSMIVSRSSSSGNVKWNERIAGGRGNSHTPMRVTMPKFDWANSPSRIGPKLYFDVCQLSESWNRARRRRCAGSRRCRARFPFRRQSEMIEVGSVAGAFVERVADHAALRRARCHVEHQRVAARGPSSSYSAW